MGFKIGSLGIGDHRHKKHVPHPASLPPLSICDGTATVAQLDWASLSDDKQSVRAWPDECRNLIPSNTDTECKELKSLGFDRLVDARCTIVLVTRAYDFYIVKHSYGGNVSMSHRSQGTVKPRKGRSSPKVVGDGVREPNTDARYELVLAKLRESTPEELWKFWWNKWSAPRKTSAVMGTIRSPQTWATFVHRRVFRVVHEQIRKEVFVRSEHGVTTITSRPPRKRKTDSESARKRRLEKTPLVHLDVAMRPDRRDLARYVLYKIRIYLQEQAIANLTHRYAGLWDRQAQLFVKVFEGYSPVDDRQELAEFFGVEEDRIVKDWESLLTRLRRLREGSAEAGNEIRDLCEELFAPDEPLYDASDAERLRIFFEGASDEE